MSGVVRQLDMLNVRGSEMIRILNVLGREMIRHPPYEMFRCTKCLLRGFRKYLESLCNNIGKYQKLQIEINYGRFLQMLLMYSACYGRSGKRAKGT